MENQRVLVFSYDIDDLKKEVFNRSTYIGKMRGTKDVPDFVDRMSLTPGESFLSNEFIDSAVSESFDYIRPYARDLKHACMSMHTYTDHLQYKNNGIKITYDNKEYNIGEEIQISCDFETSVSTNKIKIDVNSGGPVYKCCGGNVTAYISRHFFIEYNLDNIVFDKEVIDANLSHSFTNGTTSSNLGRTVNLTFNYDDGGTTRNVTNVYAIYTVDKVVYDTEETFNVGDIIELHSTFVATEPFDTYIIFEKCTNNDWQIHSDLLQADPRNHIVFTTVSTREFDYNLINRVDRNIKEALVNYILYRWFEYTNPEEAGVFYNKFEDQIHKAKMGLDSEVHILQRRYRLY